MITILEIVGIALVFALSFVFGVIFARHNAKKAQAIQDAVNAASERAKKAADEIIAEAKQAAKADSNL